MSLPSRALLVLSLFIFGCTGTLPARPNEVSPAAPSPGGAKAPEPSNTPDPARDPRVSEVPRTFDLQAVDAYVARQVKERGFVGLSLAIVQNGKVVLARGYGKSSLEPAADVQADTVFAVGSITKQFASACIFLLAEEGKLSVDDKVSKYYPGLTRAGEITLYDLMTHTSGYPDYYPLDFVDRRMQKPISPDALLQQYAGGKLEFDPGTRWSYSNTGYILLGRVVEKVTGESFGKFLERRILKPLGMDHSTFEPKPGTAALATGHTAFALGDPAVARPEGEGWLHAAAGLYSTASDLAKWDLALMQGKVLKPASYLRMTTPRKLSNGITERYGCGLDVSQRHGELVLGHDGAISGFLSYGAMAPRTTSAVILLTNSDFLDAGPLHRELFALLLNGQESAIPRVEGPSPTAVALDMLHQMQAGTLDRGKLGEELDHYLSAERVRGSAARLLALGEPTRVEIDAMWERGGMEVAAIVFTFAATSTKALLYRTPDGKIQQFLLYKS